MVFEMKSKKKNKLDISVLIVSLAEMTAFLASKNTNGQAGLLMSAISSACKKHKNVTATCLSVANVRASSNISCIHCWTSSFPMKACKISKQLDFTSPFHCIFKFSILHLDIYSQHPEKVI